MTLYTPLAADGPDRAAIMVMLLGEEDASRLLSQLAPEELHLLGTKMCNLGEISADAIRDAIRIFASKASDASIPAHQRVQDVRRIITGAVGDLKADNLMRRVAPDEPAASGTPALDLARWLAPEIIITLMQDEPPQTIAVLLLQLEPTIAAHVLAGLPDDLHTPVVHRIARLGPVSPEALSILEATLAAKISQAHGRSALKLGGVKEAAEIINNSVRSVERRVMPAISRIDKQIARELENEMFKFEHLFVLNPPMMGQLLREVDSEILIDSLRGLAPEDRDYFFAAMSSRAADGLRDEIEARGRIRRADVDIAQRKIIAVARQLAADGAIVLGQGDDDYV